MEAERDGGLGSSAVARRLDVCALSMVRRVAAMLDLDPDQIVEGAPLPRGWHFFLLGGDTRRSALRPDGFPGFGLPMPQLDLPRLLLGGRTIRYDSEILVGSQVERRSRIVRLDQKSGPAGPSAVITLQHELHPTSQASAAITETQTYILLGAGAPAKVAVADTRMPAGQMTLTPDETLLFLYSALGFNSHKIHLDRAYARDIEGLPDLVVNGGLVTLLATEYLRTELGVKPRSLTTRHTAPLFCGRPISFDVRHEGSAITLIAHNEAGVPAMTMEVETT
jgi:3-methylfumaryl-CoA hydratase